MWAESFTTPAKMNELAKAGSLLVGRGADVAPVSIDRGALVALRRPTPGCIVANSPRVRLKCCRKVTVLALIHDNDPSVAKRAKVDLFAFARSNRLEAFGLLPCTDAS